MKMSFIFLVNKSALNNYKKIKIYTYYITSNKFIYFNEEKEEKNRTNYNYVYQPSINSSVNGGG